ncbi:hypothetical protein MRX96_021182 [Rhipicephalus microplus]
MRQGKLTDRAARHQRSEAFFYHEDAAINRPEPIGHSSKWSKYDPGESGHPLLSFQGRLSAAAKLPRLAPAVEATSAPDHHPEGRATA